MKKLYINHIIISKKEKNFPFFKKIENFCNILIIFRLLLGERMESTLEQNIEEIYEEHSKLVYKYIFCKCRDESLAEEITQETFLIATKEIKKFRGESKIETWLCEIARKVLSKELKRMKKAKIISMDSEIGEIKSDFDIEEDFIENAQTEEVYKEIEKLDEPLKDIVLLKLKADMSFVEISDVLGKSENSVRVKFYRWKQQMIEKFNRKEEE